jgi:hypothetical protein
MVRDDKVPRLGFKLRKESRSRFYADPFWLITPSLKLAQEKDLVVVRVLDEKQPERPAGFRTHCSGASGPGRFLI